MAKPLKVKTAKKAEKKGLKTGKTKKPGPVKEAEVAGQSEWVLVQCPWCGGLVWAWDTPEYQTWSCAWCGGLFAEF
jgi:ribosomal protein S27E